MFKKIMIHLDFNLKLIIELIGSMVS